MYQPWTPTMIKAYHDARLEEMNKHHSLRIIRPRGSRLHERLLLRVGAFLVGAGQKLQERYQPGLGSSPDICQSTATKASA